MIQVCLRHTHKAFLFHQEIADPEDEKNFYEDSEDSDKEHKEDKGESTQKKKPYVMDSDHRLLLRTCKPLLNSRNAAVGVFTMSVFSSPVGSLCHTHGVVRRMSYVACHVSSVSSITTRNN